MKKSVLSIVAIAFAAVSVLSSCDKNDDGYGQTAKTTTVESQSTNTLTSSSADNSANYFHCAYFISEDMASLGTYTVTVSDGSKSSEYDIVSQGKLDTYNIHGVMAKGYLFTYKQPATDGVKATVKYTPNDKVKTLTENDDVNLTNASCHFTSGSSNPDYMSHLAGGDLRQTQGDLAEETIQNVLKIMNR